MKCLQFCGGSGLQGGSAGHSQDT